jgi:polygalacturonase
MKTIAAIYLSLALPLCAATFNVRDFGATGDGKTVDTAAIQKALDACKTSGGTVEFPAGNYLSQPLTIRTKTIFQLDAGVTLQASTNQMDFMKSPGDWLKAKSGSDFIPFIGGKDLTDVTFTGSGVIDGGGAVWWGEAEKARQIVRLHLAAPEPDCHRTLQKSAAGKPHAAKLAKVSFRADGLRGRGDHQRDNPCAGTRGEHGCD